MEKVKKIVLPVLAGIAYGVLGFWWVIYAAMFAFPGTSRGSRDWEEDVFFIPIGYIMFAIFMFVTGIIIFKYRKRIRTLMKFILCVVLTVGMIIGITGCGRIPLYNEGESNDSVIRDDIANALIDEGDSIEINDEHEVAEVEEEPILKEWENGLFVIDDVSYEMPFVFSELTKAGWTVSEDEEEKLSSILQPGENIDRNLHMQKEGYPELIFLVGVTNLTEESLPLLDCQVTSIWYDAKNAMESGGEYPTISVNGLVLGSSLENVKRCFGTYEVRYESETLTMVSYEYYEGEKALYLTFDYNEELGVTAVICNAFGY